MVHLTLKLEKTAYTRGQLQAEDLPQIALAGRSNVGKSSLINCLAGRKKLARTSSTPGKTRSINFYLALPDKFYLVDLPGYGYARCSQKEREKWALLIQAYLMNNAGLRAVVLLLDARVPPQAMDLELARYVSSLQIRLLPVLTKTDKCSQKQIRLVLDQWRKLLDQDMEPVLFSAKTKRGLDELLNLLRTLIKTGSPSVHKKNLDNA